MYFRFRFFPVVFCSIGFPIEKHKKFRSKEKNCYYFFTTI